MRLTGLIHAVEAHAEGEPARVIVGGVVDVPGATMFEKKLYLERERDSLRRLLLFEPRGQAALSADLVLPPTRPEADAGFIIMESADYPAMSGSNTICVVTVLLETGMLPIQEPLTELTLEAPAGLVRVRAECRDGRVRRVTFQNLPAYAAHLDAHVEVPGLGTVTLDVAYGGVYFAIVEAASVGLRVKPDEAADLVVVGERIKAAAAEQLPVVHPENPDIHTITFTELTAPPDHPEAHGKNAVVVSPGRLDRSPCGTGTCARMAALYARGQLGLEQDFVHESTIGTLFTGRLVGTAAVGPYQGVIPTISGRGWITGIHQYATDPEDPLAGGFTLSDTWGWARRPRAAASVQ
jgi:proline racemase